MDFLGIDFSCAFGSLRSGPDSAQGLPASHYLQAPRLLHRRRFHHRQSPSGSVPHQPLILSSVHHQPSAKAHIKNLKHKSIRGLSTVAFELEVVGYTIALAYCLHKELPFSAYGELLFLLIQGIFNSLYLYFLLSDLPSFLLIFTAIILVAIIYYYSQPVGIKTWIRALLYCAVAPTVLAGQVDPVLFEALYASQHAIFFFARVPQIWANFRGAQLVIFIVINSFYHTILDNKQNKSTGELSFLTCLMNFGGSMVRVFTSIQEKAPTSAISESHCCQNSQVLPNAGADMKIVAPNHRIKYWSLDFVF
ncbi:Mannose-P-dolichol utilization defect 1 protein-like 2 [Vitis vinifera]|uniref:Mannose-P-dolichol utilization defect 1 protein-like 2 n=1 Tax=Vitis vinifera TaxID=29760 RepID=A0A438ITE6_VITVI|nr:Mannose-P-dolichol utilization defect 1 protein-like 2 [Vitis vinifera]